MERRLRRRSLRTQPSMSRRHSQRSEESIERQSDHLKYTREWTGGGISNGRLISIYKKKERLTCWVSKTRQVSNQKNTYRVFETQQENIRGHPCLLRHRRLSFKMMMRVHG